MKRGKPRRLRACRCRASEAPELKRIFWWVIRTATSRAGFAGIRTKYTVKCEYCGATWETTSAYAGRLQRRRP